MSKVLGIIGGMGPLATVKLFEDIVLLTKASKDQEHIHILIDNNTSIPDRTDYILGINTEDPRKELIKSALKLEEMGADYLVMPCNTAHSFYDQIVENISIPFLNMIEETAIYLKKQNPNIGKVGLLSTEGTIEAEVYDTIFKEYDIEVLKPSKGNQKYITNLIYNIKEGIQEDNIKKVYRVIDDLKQENAEILIAGCTEISVAVDMYNIEGIIDPMKILSKKAIEFAGKVAKKI
ncbi:MAG TPA: amino acid racemase [Tissierellaceae bacterium]|nr:amino acid racemase [Tissierellaceae bacterium]